MYKVRKPRETNKVYVKDLPKRYLRLNKRIKMLSSAHKMIIIWNKMQNTHKHANYREVKYPYTKKDDLSLEVNTRPEWNGLDIISS